MRSLIDEIFIDSKYTGRRHHIRVLRPEVIHPSNKYPVVYLLDGQNVFFDDESYGGHSWRIREFAASQPLENQMIYVAIDNDAKRRYEEYSPWKNEIPKTNFEAREYGGEGRVYANFIVNEVKAYVDIHYSTEPSPQKTFLMGSSMGAFIAVYTGLEYQNAIGNIGCFSIASWFAEKAFLNYLETVTVGLDMKIFLSVGGRETSDSNIKDMDEWYKSNTWNLYETLKNKGIDEEHMKYVYVPAGEHNEKSWSEIFPDAMRFLTGIEG